MTTRITCISDLHGFTPVIPETDILLIGGDIALRNGRKNQRREWRRKYLPWLREVPATHIVFVGGNHDWLLADENFKVALIPQLPSNAFYLEDSSISLHINNESLLIYGTPWQTPYGSWAFMKPEKELVETFNEIRPDAEILLCHSPPWGILDEVPGRGPQGSVALANRIADLPNLKLCVFGHIHEGWGWVVKQDTVFVNSPIRDCRYNINENMHTVVLEGKNVVDVQLNKIAEFTS